MTTITIPNTTTTPPRRRTLKPFTKDWCEWETYPTDGPFETGILWRSAPRWEIVDCARRPVGIFAPAARIGGKIRRIGPWQDTVGVGFTPQELAQWEARTDPILGLGSGTAAQILMRLPPGTRTIIRDDDIGADDHWYASYLQPDKALTAYLNLFLDTIEYLKLDGAVFTPENLEFDGAVFTPEDLAESAWLSSDD